MKKHLLIIYLISFSLSILAQEIKSNSFRVNNMIISKDEADTKPPLLEVSNIMFTDANGNNRIDANEECFVTFDLTNNGKGNALNLKVDVNNKSNITGLIYNKSIDVGKIEPGKIKTVIIPISGAMQLTSGKAILDFNFVEAKGFQPEPISYTIETKEFDKPDVKVVDHSFFSNNSEIKLGFPIQLKVLLQNKGQGLAENVNVNFIFPSANVFPNDASSFSIGNLTPGSAKELVFEFQPNKLYAEKTIPITVNITERHGKFGDSKTFSAIVDGKSSGKTIEIASTAVDNVINIETPSLTADVDKSIPFTTGKHPYRFALIIGNEDYTSRQSNLKAESNVHYAVNDAKVFKEYTINTLGCEEKNVFFLTNATSGEMNQEIQRIVQMLNRLGNKSELIFFYAGHGFPQELTGIPYLIPVDVSATNLNQAIKLNDVFASLSQTNAARITVFLDACFTGGGREAGLLAARSLMVAPKKEELKGNMVVFTATSKDQSALPYHDNKHGMFTYFLLKKLQESKGEVTYGELDTYLNNNVSIESLRKNRKEQDPETFVSKEVQNTWENWKMK